MMIYKTLKTNKYKIFWFFLAVFWMALIFYFSAQRADASGRLSGSLCYRMANAINRIFSLDWTEEILLHYASVWDHPIRKAAHMTEYGILAVIFLGNFFQYPQTYDKRYLLAGGAAALYAASDEFHQLFVEGRSGEFRDVCIDSMGGILGLCMAWLLLKLVSGMQKKIRQIENR